MNKISCEKETKCRLVLYNNKCLSERSQPFSVKCHHLNISKCKDDYECEQAQLKLKRIVFIVRGKA